MILDLVNCIIMLARDLMIYSLAYSMVYGPTIVITYPSQGRPSKIVIIEHFSVSGLVLGSGDKNVILFLRR